MPEGDGMRMGPRGAAKERRGDGRTAVQLKRAASASPLGSILEHLRSRPSRTWSIVVTVFGDVVVPRGGSLGVASLLEIFAAMSVKGGVVRTALSRLATDDWLQGNRVGRNSFYRLTRKGQASFDIAAQRVYGDPDQDWDGRFHLVLPDGGAGQDTVRDALREAGFGSAGPGLWIAPTTRQVPAEAAALTYVQGTTTLEAGRQLVGRAWALESTGAAYQRFLDAFGPLLDWAASGGPLSDLDALVARILLVHEFRRVVLRDPLLPRVLLPDRWPGTPARQLCSRAYQALLPGSERWLDRNGQMENGPLPPAVGLQGRFRPPVGPFPLQRLGGRDITEFP